MISEPARSAAAALVDRELTLDEASRYLDTPMDDEERAAILDLVRWFTTRYSTPAERLAYVRRAYRRWQRAKRVVPPVR
jgi:hypothetical protein